MTLSLPSSFPLGSTPVCLQFSKAAGLESALEMRMTGCVTGQADGPEIRGMVRASARLGDNMINLIGPDTTAWAMNTAFEMIALQDELAQQRPRFRVGNCHENDIAIAIYK